MASEERLRELEEKYEGFTVYDNQGSKIGKVDDLFVDESDQEEYIGVKMGFFGTKSTLIPTEIVRVNERDRSIEVSESKDHVKDAPNFSDDDDIDAGYEERIRSHFGLQSLESSGRGSYSGGAAAGGAASGTEDRDAEYASSGQDTDREGESSGYETHSDDRVGSSGTTSGDRDTGEYGDQTGSSDSETYGDEAAAGASAGGAGETTERDQYQETGTSSGQQETGSTGSTGTSGQGSSTTGKPTTSRQTEETETFQEDGRTKVRRRVIREEVVDADDQ